MSCDPVNRLPRLVTTLVMAGALLASLALMISGTAVAAPAAEQWAAAYITAPNDQGTNSFCP
jgi:hypothetical protein